MPRQRISDRAQVWYTDRGTGMGDFYLVDPLPGDRAHVWRLARWDCDTGMVYETYHETATADHWSTMTRVSNMRQVSPGRAREIMDASPTLQHTKGQ